MNNHSNKLFIPCDYYSLAYDMMIYCKMIIPTYSMIKRSNWLYLRSLIFYYFWKILFIAIELSNEYSEIYKVNLWDEDSLFFYWALEEIFQMFFYFFKTILFFFKDHFQGFYCVKYLMSSDYLFLKVVKNLLIFEVLNYHYYSNGIESDSS
jgi:hypothetical protein